MRPSMKRIFAGAVFALCLLGAVLSAAITQTFQYESILETGTWNTYYVMEKLEDFTLWQALQADADNTQLKGFSARDFQDNALENVYDLLSSQNFQWRITGDGIDTGSAFEPEKEGALLYGTFTFQDGRMKADQSLTQYSFDPVHSNSWINNNWDAGTITEASSVTFPDGLTFTYAIPKELVPEQTELFSLLYNGASLEYDLIVVLGLFVFLTGLCVLLFPFKTERTVAPFSWAVRFPIEPVLLVLFCGSLLWMELTSASLRHVLAFPEAIPQWGQWLIRSGMVFVLLLLAAMDCFFVKSLFCMSWKERSLVWKFRRQGTDWLMREVFGQKKLFAFLLVYILFLLLVMTNHAWTLCFWAMVLALPVGCSALKKVRKDMAVIEKEADLLAWGDFSPLSEENAGIFQEVQRKLNQVRTGFQKALQEQTASVNLRNELISNVSHDLKTPMTGILSYADLLEKSDDPDKMKDYARKVIQYTDRLQELVTDLFDVSKANAGSLPLERMDLDLQELVGQTLHEYDEAFEKKHLEMVFDFEKGAVLLLDPDKTMRIFDNLFGNVAKYAQDHTRVFVEGRKENGCWKVEVKNTSALPLNLSEEEVTERFVRGDKSRHEVGSGLGLAIVKSFAEAQGGRLEIKIDGDLFKAVLSFPFTPPIPNA